MKNGKNILLGMIGFVLIGTSIYSVISFGNQHNESIQLEKKLNERKNALTIATTKYYDQTDVINQKAFKDGAKSSNDIVKTMSIHNTDVKVLNTVSREFFKTFYTWDSSSEYAKNMQELQSKISDNFDPDLKKSVFAEDKDTTGNSYIKSMGLHSKYLGSDAFLNFDSSKTDIINGVVQVKLKSWSTGFLSGETKTVYKFGYDKKAQKITSIENLATLKSIL